MGSYDKALTANQDQTAVFRVPGSMKSGDSCTFSVFCNGDARMSVAVTVMVEEAKAETPAPAASGESAAPGGEEAETPPVQTSANESSPEAPVAPEKPDNVGDSPEKGEDSPAETDGAGSAEEPSAREDGPEDGAESAGESSAESGESENSNEPAEDALEES